MSKRGKFALGAVVLGLVLFVLVEKCAWRLPLTGQEEEWCAGFQIHLPDGVEATIDNILPHCVLEMPKESKAAITTHFTSDQLRQFIPARGTVEGALSTDPETGVRRLAVYYTTVQEQEVVLLYFDDADLQFIVEDQNKDTCYITGADGNYKWVNFRNCWYNHSSDPLQLPVWLSFLYT